MAFRYLTNLRTPYDTHDTKLLSTLGTEGTDYAIGPPIEAKPLGVPLQPHECASELPPVPLAKLKETGIIGLYATHEALMRQEARRFTGWNIRLQDWIRWPELGANP